MTLNQFEKKAILGDCKALSDSKIIGHIANVEFEENVIIENYLGPMNAICTKCQASHFHFEYNQKNQLPQCCRNGEVVLPENPPYPAELEKLATGKTAERVEF